jgi:Fe-S cluster biogenesis protein NfuA
VSTTDLELATVHTALEPVRAVLQADGADLELIGVDGDVAHLRLVVADAACAECVLPTPLLQEVALQLMQPLAPGLAAVAIDDPRAG